MGQVDVVTMDVGSGFFIPIANLFREVLTIQVNFFGNQIPLYAFLLFGVLIGLFIRVISLIAGLHL